MPQGEIPEFRVFNGHKYRKLTWWKLAEGGWKMAGEKVERMRKEGLKAQRTKWYSYAVVWNGGMKKR